MKRLVTLLRHSETTGNVEQILMGGRIDFPLTENGKKIAKNAALEIKKYHFDTIYCSNNQRTKDTLEIVLSEMDDDIKNKVIYTDSLKEQDYGTITGRKVSQLTATHQQKYMADPFYFCHEDGESLLDVKNRVALFFQEHIEKGPGENILLVTHENYMRAAIAYMKNLDREVANLKFNYCSFTQYEYERGTYISTFFNRSQS